MPDTTPAAGRYGSLDTLRGLALISMVLYHAVWDLSWLAHKNIPWFHGIWEQAWQLSISGSFILLSGFCWALGRRQFRRGAVLLLAGGLVTAVTLLFLPEARILYGVLSLLGLSALLLIPLSGPLHHIPAELGALAALALFLLCFRIPHGYLGPLRLPEFLYRCSAAAWLGFPTAEFFSADYFPLLPWFFLYLAGFFCFRIPKIRQLLLRLPDIPGVQALGRHSLPLYLLHQPLLYLLLKLLGLV